jgi:hypothetical protein
VLSPGFNDTKKEKKSFSILLKKEKNKVSGKSFFLIGMWSLAFANICENL